MPVNIPLGLIPLTAGWRKNDPRDNTVTGINNDLFGGLKVVRTRAEMLAIHPNYLQPGYAACLVIKDGSVGNSSNSSPSAALYSLESAASFQDATAYEDWLLIDTGTEITSGLTFVGLYTEIEPVLTDADAGITPGNFYVVDTSVAININSPDLFEGVATVLNNNDWIIYQDGLWVHIDRTDEFTVTWDTLTGKPQVILDLEAGLLPEHTHEEFNDLGALLPVDIDFTWNFNGVKNYQLPQDNRTIKLNWVIIYGNHLPKDNLSHWLDTDEKKVYLGEDINPTNRTKIFINCTFFAPQPAP